MNSVVHCSPGSRYVARYPPATAIAYEFEDVGPGGIAWTEVCYIQYFRVRVSQVKHIIEMAPNMQFLASAGARRRGSVVVDTGYVDPNAGAFGARNSGRIDIQIWFPPQQAYIPETVSKVVRERPTEGIITSIKPKTDMCSCTSTSSMN